MTQYSNPDVLLGISASIYNVQTPMFYDKYYCTLSTVFIVNSPNVV